MQSSSQQPTQEPSRREQSQLQPSDLASVLSFFQVKSAYYQAHFLLYQHSRDQYLADFYREAVAALEGFQQITQAADTLPREEFLFLFRPGGFAQFTERDAHMLNVATAEIEAKRDRDSTARQPMEAFHSDVFQHNNW